MARRPPRRPGGARTRSIGGAPEELPITITTDTDQASGFDELGLRPELLRALAELGYEEPTPIQRESIPQLVAGHDLLGQAATGTGKTAAFALPALQRLAAGERGEGGPSTLVLVPTRELAMQVSEAFHRYGRGVDARVVPVFGGQPIGRQLHALRNGVDVVVATPGRAIDHINRKSLDLDGVAMVVLDEADEMLDMGFAEDIETILSSTPSTRQTVLFSATMPPRIAGLAKRHLNDPVRIEIRRTTPEPGDAPLVRQTAYVVPRAYKPAALGRVLDVEAPDATIVFCRTRTEVDQLTEKMNGRGYRAEALHGGMSQEQRDRVMARLRAGNAELLVATDVAARGLDIDQLTHVVNYDVPSAPESYVHRIGRVGRAGREGVAITLAEPREQRLLQNIERVIGQSIPIEKIPSVEDLRVRRLDHTTEILREMLRADELEEVGPILEQLSADFDVAEIALAAIKMAFEAQAGNGDDDEDDIPEVKLRTERGPRPTGAGPSGARGERGSGRTKDPSPGMTRLFVGVGRTSGIRPGDLVGAIAGEAGLRGKDVGSIQISERFSLVEVPEAEADNVITALKRTTIKGKKASVRRERF